MQQAIEAEVRQILAAAFKKAPQDIELHIPFSALAPGQRNSIHDALTMRFGLPLPSLEGWHAGEAWHNPMSSPMKVIEYLNENWFAVLTQKMPNMMDEIAA